VFRCQICNQIAPAGTRANRVVLASRSKSYASRGGGGRDGFRGRFRGPRVSRKDYDKGGQGHEIVQEVLACESCAKQVTPVIEPEAPVEPPVTDAADIAVAPESQSAE
jgi:hypothetical protein